MVGCSDVLVNQLKRRQSNLYATGAVSVENLLLHGLSSRRGHVYKLAVFSNRIIGPRTAFYLLPV